jgi:transcriptional regulator with XRE-family HTH domain
VDINNNILSLIKASPGEILKGLAERVKARRLESALTQKELAKRAGIPLPTYRRFEHTGEISLRGLVMLGIALDMYEEFSSLFSTKTYADMDDLLKAISRKRKRGKRNG